MVSRLMGPLLLLAVLTAVACAQGDFPTFKGGFDRTGKNNAPNSSGPGAGLLKWYHPNPTDGEGRTQTIDNAMMPTGTDPQYIRAIGSWLEPDPSNEAPSAYIPPDIFFPAAGVSYTVSTTVTAGAAGVNQALANTTGIFPGVPPAWPGDTLNFAIAAANPTVASVTDLNNLVLATPVTSTTGETVKVTSPRPDYVFAKSIPSSPLDNTVPLNPSDTLSTFTWSLRNTVPPTPGGSLYDGLSYAVYVYLPTGPQTSNGTQQLPQDVFVYRIDDVDGSHIVTVNSSSATAGGGWIRVGLDANGNAALYTCDGVHPINVTLFNTIPRDPATGNLTQAGPNAVVYADAVRAVPEYGFYAATPIVSSFNTAAGPLTTRTIGVLNEEVPGHKTLSTTVITGANAAVQNLVSTVGMNIGDVLSFGTPAAASGTIVSIPDLTHVQLAAAVYTMDGEDVSDASVFQHVTSIKGLVTSYAYDMGTVKWKFSPQQESTLTFEEDDNNPNVPSQPPGSPWVSSTTAANFRGADYLSAPSVIVPPATSASAAAVVYPSRSLTGVNLLNPGSYDIYAWIPGDSNGVTFAHALQYEVHEGSTVTVVAVNQSLASGWTRIGTRSYFHDPAHGNDISVVVTDFSNDLTDASRTAFTDAIRFVGPASLEITSTPIQTTIPIIDNTNTLVNKPVVIVATENGTIYCLDAEGRGDGSTNIYWTYPSTPDPDVTPGTWLDPNLNGTNIDGKGNVLMAEMPGSFGLSSPALAPDVATGHDFLYIGDHKGRVYCIDTAGRGDYNFAKGRPGTTSRVWSYPNDYPALPRVDTKLLGSIDASVAVALDTNSKLNVYVPTSAGRLFALDATGNSGTHTTTLNWQFPLAGATPFAPIEMTPTVDFGRVYFGTAPRDNSAGQFMAVKNIGAASPDWTLSGNTTQFAPFLGGPATVPSTLNPLMNDSIYVSNDNGGIYAVDAANGNIEWQAYDRPTPVEIPLTYTFMNVYDSSGAKNPASVIIAPENDGEVAIYTASTTNTNKNGGHFDGGYGTKSNSLTAAASVGWQFMYFADNAGYLYALTTTGGTFTGPILPPLTTISSPNNPIGQRDYANAKVKLVTKNAYLQLRQGTMYYADALDPSNEVVRNPMAFEWGETIYLMVYDYPFLRAGTTVPPVVNLNFSVGGETVRNVFTESHIFSGIGDPVLDAGYLPGFNPADPHSAYAILSFTIQGAGANALPPGPGQITIGFNTVDPSGSPINYPATFRQTIYVANPLGLNIPSPDGPDQTIGYTNNTSSPENLMNGSAVVPNLLGTVGDVTHGQSGDLAVGVIDRSLVELIRGPGRGLQNVRVERADLAWQNGGTPGQGAPLNAIDPILFPNFEDLPGNIPNNSLDYPDIGREQVTVTEAKNGTTANPVNYPVELIGPTAGDGSQMTEANATTRAVLPTPWTFTVNVPRYQPANQKPGADHNTGGSPDVPAGYMGTYYVFVDSSGNGVLDRANNFFQSDSQAPSQTREAFRNFSFAGAVPPDQRIDVLTPTVDLGSLAEGTGYTPAPPGPANGLFSPWTGTYQSLFKPFDVANDGNVNLLNLRLAKSTTTDDLTLDPWQILSPANEDLAYLSGTLDFWSDMDPGYAPTKDISPDAMVILQKSRVGDRFSRKLTPNPQARVNANLGLTADAPRLPIGTYPIRSPEVAATVPFGFPVGTYNGILRVIEDTDKTGQVKNGGGAYTMPGTNPGSMSQDLNPSNTPIEVNSDPSLRVVLKVRESRVSNAATPMTAPFLDNLVSGTEAFRYSNLQPSGFRNPTNGSLVAAMSSNRGSWTPASAATARPTTQWRIFVGSVQGTDPISAPGTSPLRDLYGFVPDTADGRWFHQSTQTASGFPDASLDGNIWGPYYVGGSAKYGSPVFPADGMLNPFRDVTLGMGTPLPNSLMAFVGDAQIGEAGGNKNQSKIFVAPVTVDASGATGIGNVYAMTNDPNAEKGRPSIVQTSNGFILFYSATVGGRSNIYYVLPSGTAGASQYDGSYFTDSAAVDMGNGFDSVSAPYVVGRVYRGASPPDPAKYSSNILEMTFTGKLRNRPTSELFYGRIYLDKITQVPALLAPLPVRTKEPLETGSEAGMFLSTGAQWVPNTTVTLEVLNGGVYTDLEVPSTRIVERDTGIISFDTKLGGKAYIDPSMGSVRLTGAMPPHNASLVLTYQPRFLRVSEGTTAGYASPNLGVDERVIPDISYWRRGSDQALVDGTDAVRTGRFMFTYGRAAAGAGQAARPTMKTLRFGVDLPLPVFTNPNGTTGSVSVSGLGPNGFYQIDPAKRKIYVTPSDEDRNITVTYEAANEGTGADLGSRTVVANASLITERPEELVPLDQASNEANVSMFFDPFDYMNPRRPGLVWLFWSSTRTGSPDVYMQTIAPRFTPVVTGK